MPKKTTPGRLGLTISLRIVGRLWRSFAVAAALLAAGATLGAAAEPTAEEELETALATARGAFEDRDYASALRLLLPLGEAGSAEAQTLIGVMFRTGLLGLADHDEAAAWLEAAALQDYPEARFNLGLMYFQHETLPLGAEATPDELDEAAFAQFARAAARGHSGAQLYLGHMYAEGTGVAPDPVEAYKWFQLAAWQRSRLAVGARDALAERLSADDLDEAKRRAHAFAPETQPRRRHAIAD